MINKITKNENGYTLLSVLIFMIIIMLILMCLVRYTLVQYKFFLHDSHQVQADYLAESGIAYFVNDIQAYYESIIATPGKEYASCYIVENDSILVHAIPWGGFIKANVKASYKSANSVKQALIGQQFSKNMNSAITLDDVDNPLVLVGDTEINGDVFVGTRGVKSGNIKGMRFRGQRLVNGKIVTSTKSRMEPLNIAVSFQATVEMLASLEYVMQSLEKDNLGTITDSLKTYIYSPQDIKLTDFTGMDSTCACTLMTAGALFIDGGISLPEYSTLVASDSIVLNDCHFCNALIYSRDKIIISDECTGSGQFLSDHSIVVNENTTLVWPSVLFVNRDNPVKQPAEAIQLGENVSVDGAVILWSSNVEKINVMNSARIEIGKGAMVNGLVYTNLGVLHRGTINGHISLRSFYLYQSPTHYINYLLDGKINRDGIHSDFPIPLVFSDEPQYTLFNWGSNLP